MKSHRKALAVITLFLVLFLVMPGGLAVVADKPADKTNKRDKPETTSTDPLGAGRKDDQQLRAEIKNAVKPYQESIRENQQACQELCEELALDILAARQRVNVLLSATVTEIELTHLQEQMTALRELTAGLCADKGNMSHEMSLLRGYKTDLDLAGITGSFDHAIAIQEARLTLITTAILQVRAICPD